MADDKKPIGFHRVSSDGADTFIEGHIYFFYDQHRLCVAEGTTAEDLVEYSSRVYNVQYSPGTKVLLITGVNGAVSRVNLADFAGKTQLGDLTALETENKSNLVSAINEVLASVEAGGTGSKVTITEKSAVGFAKSYEFKQGSTLIGTVNIPKDLVVSGGTVETDPVGHPAGTYLVLTLANATGAKVYINVGTLVDLYTAAQNAAQVQLTVNPVTREISAVIVAGSIGSTELATGAVTSNKIADEAVQGYHIADSQIGLGHLAEDVYDVFNSKLEPSDITTGPSNGSISVKGKTVTVKGLGSAAYQQTTAFATPADVTEAVNAAKSYTDNECKAVLAAAQNYANGLHSWSTWEEEA